MLVGCELYTAKERTSQQSGALLIHQAPTRTHDEEPGTGEAADEVKEVQQEVDEDNDEGRHGDKLHPARSAPEPGHAGADKDYQA